MSNHKKPVDINKGLLEKTVDFAGRFLSADNSREFVEWQTYQVAKKFLQEEGLWRFNPIMSAALAVEAAEKVAEDIFGEEPNGRYHTRMEEFADKYNTRSEKTAGSGSK